MASLLVVAGLGAPASLYLRHRASQREVAVRSVQAESAKAVQAQAKATCEALDQLSRNKQAQDEKLTAAAAAKAVQTEMGQHIQAAKSAAAKSVVAKPVVAKSAAAKSTRTGCLHISKECVENPLSTDCN